MPAAKPSHSDLARIGSLVASADSVDAAIERAAAETALAFASRVCVFQHSARGWMLVAQSGGGLRLPVSDLILVLDALPAANPIASVDLRAFGAGTWTALSLALDDVSWLLLLAGDAAGDAAARELGAALPFALQAARERESRMRQREHFVTQYAMTRRLSRIRPLESVCGEVARHVAAAVRADRVSVALYRPPDDHLRIVAAHGAAASTIVGASAEPGAWVMGHVYASGRPLLVRDVRTLPSADRSTMSRYRTTSFVSVPIVTRTETIGVVNATDHADGSAFGQDDLDSVRSLAGAAALGITAAVTDTEVHRLSRVASVDALTALFNRPYFETRLHQEIERAKRGGSSLTLLMADIDDFKAINDTYGHQVGDAVLQAVSAALRPAVRVFDVCARYGGDEFGILMPSSDQSNALAFAERIRQRVAEHRYAMPDLGQVPAVTMSVGVALFESGDTAETFVRRADEALYQAKTAGKNRVHLGAGRANVLRLPTPATGQGSAV